MSKRIRSLTDHPAISAPVRLLFLLVPALVLFNGAIPPVEPSVADPPPVADAPLVVKRSPPGRPLPSPELQPEAGRPFFFEGGMGFEAGSYPRLFKVADLDGDGELDVVTGSHYQKALLLLRGRGDARFSPPLDLPLRSPPGDCDLADFNGDGHLDIIVTQGEKLGLALFFGAGNGRYGERVDILDNRVGGAVATGDFNGDLVPDLALSRGRGQVMIMTGAGDGSFDEAGSFEVAERVKNLVALDLNNDQILDLLTASSWTREFAVQLGRGDGSFHEAATYPFSAHTVFGADVDLDNNIDLVLGGGKVLFGHGDGTFEEVKHHYWLSKPRSAGIGDLNRDGIPDMVIGCYGAMTRDRRLNETDRGRIAVCFGRGGGGFRSPLLFAPGGGSPLHLADLDHDGCLDVVTLGNMCSSVVVLRGRGDGSFVSMPCQKLESGAQSLARGDFNGDGIIDLAAPQRTQRHDCYVALLCGLGDGDYAEPLEIAAGKEPRLITACDHDLDGDIDLVVTNRMLGISLLLNRGDGTFEEPLFMSIEKMSSAAVETGDLDGDGYPDLVLPMSNWGVVAVLLNDREGGFQVPIRYPATRYPSACGIGDMDSDGDLDLVLDDMTGFVWILPNNGDGTFGEARSHEQPDARGLALGDLNMDGRLDVVVGHYDLARLTALLGDGDGSFFASIPMAANSDNTKLILHDMNLDGYLDLVSLPRQEDLVSVYMGRGDGRFGPGLSFQVTSPGGMICDDLDRDGDPDLALSSFAIIGYGQLCFLRNTTINTPSTAADGQGRMTPSPLPPGPPGRGTSADTGP